MFFSILLGLLRSRRAAIGVARYVRWLFFAWQPAENGYRLSLRSHGAGSWIFGAARKRIFLFSIALSYLELATNGMREGVEQ